jgi:hypothetical protein
LYTEYLSEELEGERERGRLWEKKAKREVDNIKVYLELKVGRV